MDLKTARKLVLHIGAHKTGSTAIQRFLHHRKTALLARNWMFCTPQGHPPNWGFMFKVIPKQLGARFTLGPSALAQLLAEIDAGHQDVILSAEDLFFLDAPEIKTFAIAIESRFSDISIVCYLRRQDQMALSQWAQGGRTVQSALIFGNADNPLPKLTPFVRRYLDFAARLNDWQIAFPKAQCITRVYDRDTFPNRDIVVDFLGVTGIDLKPVTAPAEANVALGASTVRFLYLLRDAGISQADIRRMLQSSQIPVTSDKILPSRQEAVDFVAAFAAGNAKLAAKQIIFSDDFSMYLEESHIPPLDPAFVTASLLAILNSTLKLIPTKPDGASAEILARLSSDPFP